METKKKKYEAVVDMLGHGRQQAIHLNVLSDKLDMSKRLIKTLIQEARNDGAMICSDTNGYYLAVTVGDVRTFLNYMDSRFIANRKQTKAMRKLLKEFPEDVAEDTPLK